MAKPLGPKTRLIREAITANPNTGNKALAEQINSSDARQQDQIKVTPFEVAEQRGNLKKLEKASTPAAEPRPRSPPARSAAGPRARRRPRRASPRRPRSAPPAPSN